MLDHNAHFFCKLSFLIGSCLHKLGNTNNAPDPPEVGEALIALWHEAGRMNLFSVSAQLNRIGETIRKNEKIETDEFQISVRELFNRLSDELENRIFFGVEKEMENYISQKKPLFNDLVYTLLPMVVEDFSEAAKCLALERYTACVFHLMRVMELSVRKIGEKITGIDLSDKKWGTIEGKIRDYTDSLLPFTEEKSAYSELLIHFSLVRKAWRNEVMHPKQTYTKEEAYRIYNATKSFLEDLGSMISDKSIS